jgi:DNA-directed RNA polymerase beta subunit
MSTTTQATKVFVNGMWVGIHREPQTLVRTLRALRRKVDVNTEVSLENKVLQLSCDMLGVTGPVKQLLSQKL